MSSKTLIWVKLERWRVFSVVCMPWRTRFFYGLSMSSQIGIMLNGTMIDNCVVGGPAYNTRKLEHGDVIKFVDKTFATRFDIHDLLIGKDIPGTFVTMIVAKGNDDVKILICFSYIYLLLIISFRAPCVRWRWLEWQLRIYKIGEGCLNCSTHWRWCYLFLHSIDDKGMIEYNHGFIHFFPAIYFAIYSI